MLYISGAEIEQVVSRGEMMDCIEGSMRAHDRGSYTMPLRTQVDREGNTLIMMPCLASNYWATKLLTYYPGNQAKGVPTLNGITVLYSSTDGRPLALLDGMALTAVRTGAVTGVGVRHTAPENVTRLGLVGAGKQGLYQAMFVCSARGIKEVMVYDRYGNVPAFIEKLAERVEGINIRSAASAQELMEASEVVITATTSNEPVLPDDEGLLRGRHIAGIGSYRPEMHEFPAALYRCIDRMVIDTEDAIEESGDIITPMKAGLLKKESIVTMGHALNSGINLHGQTTLYKSVGMAAFDLAASGLVYERAVSSGAGVELKGL